MAAGLFGVRFMVWSALARRRFTRMGDHHDWHVYILRCGDGTLYTGVATDVPARVERHASGRGARYTRGRGPLSLVHVERAGSKGAALRREAAIRKLGRAGKEALIASSRKARRA
jgi:putative endonuclease